MHQNEASPESSNMLIICLALGLAALAGCAPLDSDNEGEPAQPARLTIELAGTPPASSRTSSLVLKVRSVTLWPAAAANRWGKRRPHTGREPAFVFALRKEPVLIEGAPEVLAREVRVVPGRYRTVHLQLGDGSSFAEGSRILPVTGGGGIPVDLELAAGAEATLTIKLDRDRSLHPAVDGTLHFEPVAVSAELKSGLAEARGTIRGRVLPADAGAIIVIYDTEGSSSTSFTFPDPHSGDFTLEEVPIGDYRIEVNPFEPAFEARVFPGVTVPWDGQHDLGAIDLRPAARSSEAPAAGEVDGRPDEP